MYLATPRFVLDNLIVYGVCVFILYIIYGVVFYFLKRPSFKEIERRLVAELPRESLIPEPASSESDVDFFDRFNMQPNAVRTTNNYVLRQDIVDSLSPDHKGKQRLDDSDCEQGS